MRFLLSIVWTAMCLAFFMRLGFALQIMDPVDVFLDKERCAVVKSYGASSCKVKHVTADGLRLGSWVSRQKTLLKAGKLADAKQAALRRLGVLS